MTPAYLLPPLLDEYAAFMRAIAAAPDCDTPRLVLADWLEEHAGTVSCDRCYGTGRRAVYSAWANGDGFSRNESEPCLTCHGSRLVSNGCGERAEFIRMQCELAAHERLAFDPNWKAASGLREAELRLWHEVSGHFPAVGDNPVYNGASCEYRTSAGTFAVRRGFAGTVRGPLAVLLGGECGRCGGNRRGPDEFAGGTFWPTDCPDCHGTGRTPGDLERMGAELWAVEAATPTDCEPWVNLDRTHWGWWERNSYHNEDESLLDRELMLAMAADPARGDWDIGVRFTDDSPPGGCILFRAEAAARDALSQAVLALARRRAGLEATGSEATL